MSHADYHKRIMTALSEMGCDNISYEKGGKHGRMCFTFRGQEYAVPVSDTPSETRRSLLNKMSEIRRMLGIKRPVHKSGISRQKDTAPRRRPEPPELTPLPDPWEPLRRMKGDSDGRR